MSTPPTNPWVWNFEPHIQYPGLAQNIAPATNWFSQMIPSDPRRAGIEEKAVAVASYGQQLGLISELLLALAGQPGVKLDKQATKAQDRLREIVRKIETIKHHEQQAGLRNAPERLRDLKDRDPAAYDELKMRLLAVFNEKP